MSTENEKEREKMRLFVQGRSDDIDRRLTETMERLENSRRFLENLIEGEKRTRKYVTDVVESLEIQIDRLNREQKRLELEDQELSDSLIPPAQTPEIP